MGIENKKTPQQPWIFDKKKLLSELAQDIANEFWIDKQKAQDLIQRDTTTSLEALKVEINTLQTTGEELDLQEVEKLILTIKWAKEFIENSSKIDIKVLKDSVENKQEIEDFEKNIEKFLPKDLLQKAKNPKLPHEHVLWFALWTSNSIFTTADILYKIWSGILKTPYHIYMIVSWKGEVDSFKEI